MAKKDPHAVALGRLGGLKGGPARAKKLSAKRRSEIAGKSVSVRWGASSDELSRNPLHVLGRGVIVFPELE